MPIIGIDLGTTNSLVSYWSEDGSFIIPNALGERLTPSVVTVYDNGEIIVGQIAKERLIAYPQKTAAVFKRDMGTDKTFKLGEYNFLPEELSSFIIRSLKQDAEAYFGQEINEAVISVPAYFNDAQRNATKRAGELAGLKIDRLINEPTAAAIAYGLAEKASETKFLILDLGGGTFDVSILELFDDLMEVKSVAGDNYLGGEDFNKLLISIFLEQHKLDWNEIDIKAQSTLNKQAEICKRNITKSKSGIMSCTINDVNLQVSIDSQKFEESAKGLIQRLKRPIERALRDASISIEELDSIILVGGSTRMPLITSFISKLFGRLPSCSINPDEAVALGTAIQAGMKERNVALREIVLTDVCPFTLGTDIAVRTESGEYEGGYFFPIIERNTVVPVSREERLYTVYGSQKSIVVEICQGESRLTKNNIQLGKLEVVVPASPAGKEAIDIRYTYDINGILEVEVMVVSTGIKKRIVIQKNSGTMTEEEVERRLKELESIKIHPRDKQENKLLIAKGERLYEELLGEAREEVARALQNFDNVIREQNNREIKKEAKILREILDSIENYQ